MADTLDQIRGLIITEAQRRVGGGFIDDNGKPNARAIAEAMGCSVATMHRLLTARIVSTPGGHYNPSPAIMRGMQSWLQLDSETDLWHMIEAAEPAAPIRA